MVFLIAVLSSDKMMCLLGYILWKRCQAHKPCFGADT